ncbi:MAG: DUF4157 domain-containing protein [Aridibacter famidurans]|nr:DUF4157 domain-containing protein [Aridibacter famidurans]
MFATLVDTNSNSVADSSDEVLTEVWSDGGGRAIAAVSEHPGSTGGFTGRIVEYDVLGRESRSTVPTEVNSSSTPAGDDASGWLWKHTKYDWKDRVVRKINTDGTDSPSLNPSDVIISYEGCGCAGGLEITVQGEEIIETDYQGNNPVSLGRRTRKVFQDILGRVVLTQIMEWNGTSVYSETETAYNGRDQATTITQYAVENGQRTDSQVTSMTYDGHGRLSTRHRPEQSSGTSTVFVYNADDSVHSVTDARGATTTYTYEERGLVSDIDYSVPQGSSIQVPPSVEFEYDAAGNRTEMTDGMGTVTYAVSELSQLVSETRAFNETLADAPLSNNSYKLEYTYTLGGQLKSLKDPFGQRFDYAHDETGRLVSVTGATAFGGVTDYADNPGYRAWGALKHLEFGNGTEADITFDNRLRPASYSLTDGGSTDHIDKTYSYYTDGNLKYIQDGINNKHDDFYKFDQKGRLLEGLSAVEARGGTETDLEELPYRHIYEYDRFDNVTEYEITNWDVSETESFTYTNHRRDGLPSSAYDEEGNRKSGKWLDAAGRNTYFYEGWANLVRVWDGDGREIKRINKVYDFVEEDYLDPDIAYYVRSTVLGGQIITEVDDTGAKAQTFVWAGGTIVARQLMLGEDHDEETVVWDYKGAVRSTTKYLNDEGDDVSTNIDILQSGEYDPKGGFVMPYYFPPNPHAGVTDTRQRVPSPMFELNTGGCTVMWDGIQTSCDLVYTTFSEHLQLSETRFYPDIRSNGRGGWSQIIDVVHDLDHLPGGLLAASTLNPESDFTLGEKPPQEYWRVINANWALAQAQTSVIVRSRSEAPTSDLPDCLKNYFSDRWNISRSTLDNVDYRRVDKLRIEFAIIGGIGDGLGYTYAMDPKIIAFTIGSTIDFQSNAFDPSNGVSVTEVGLVAHELKHVLQFQSQRNFQLKYLLELVDQGATNVAFRGLREIINRGLEGISDIAYDRNVYERQARAFQDKVLEDINRNGNPCDPKSKNGKKYVKSN